MATLYIIATPIGNLEDVSKRALQVLAGVDLVLAEDTRVTKRLLEHYHIKKALLSYHQHSQLQKTDYILKLLKEGKNLALVSDAGTPGISDPGNKLISLISAKTDLVVNIVPIPGPSALTVAASVSGFPMDKFLFLGFPPAKRKRQKFFEEALKSKYPVIFYESTHRILRTLNDLTLVARRYSLDARLVVCQELTKKFERIYRGSIKEVLEKMQKQDLRGEFVVAVYSRK
jgi:16S rRNA (cytidine1402-2'-O)-methyltransferase